MTTFPTKTPPLAALLLAGVLLAGPLGHAARAQVRIFSDTEEAPAPADAQAPQGLDGGEAGATGAPMSILPGPKVPPPDAPPAAGPADIPSNGLVDEGGVQIGSLEQPDPSSIGTLNENNGGFAWTMWQGSDLTLVRTLMRELPGPLHSSALQDLSRRLLLTSAAVPEALTPAQGEMPPSLLTVRLGRLAASGRLEESAALLERVAPFSADPALEQRRADIYLLQGHLDQACGLAETALQRSGDAYWLRLSAFCDARNGAVDAAARTLDLLAETGSTDPLYDTLFAQLLGGQTGHAPDDMSMANVSPLIFSMLGALKVPLTAEILLSSNPMVLSAVATAENAGPVVRLEALEQAAAIGAVPVSKLAEAYMAQQFTDAQKAGAMDQVNAGGGAGLNAMLYQLVGQASDAASRLDYLSAALGLARRQGQFPLMAKLYLDATRSIEPAPEFLPHAGDVVRALLLGGATDRAATWYELVRRAASSQEGGQEGGQDMAATGTLLDIWPLFHLAERDTGVPYSDQILDLWWQAQVSTVGDERVRRGRLLFGLLEALDYTVPEHFWIEVMAEPVGVAERTPSVAHWRAMLRAAAANRVGETVLASLDALGAQGLTMTSLSTLSSVIGAFRQIGLPAEANRIAVEAAILRGL
jgi:hypothetical protein